MLDSKAEANHISDEEVPRKKLVDDEGMGCSQETNALFSSFIEWCESQGERGERLALGFQKIRSDLDEMKLTIQQVVDAQRAICDQVQEIDDILFDMEKNIVEVKQIIIEKHLELKHSKKLKSTKTRRIGSYLPYPNINMARFERFLESFEILKLQKEIFQKKSAGCVIELGLLLTAYHVMEGKLKRDIEVWDRVVNGGEECDELIKP